MSKENNLKDYLTDLYQGIASKKPNASRNPQNFRAEIESIQGGGSGEEATLIYKEFSVNGIYSAHNYGGDGFRTVKVSVPTPTPQPVTSETKTVKPSEVQQIIKPTYADYLSAVTVEPIPSDYIKPSGTLPIGVNGVYPVSQYENVSVAVTATSESPLPTEIASENEMNALLTAAAMKDNGRIYKYVGKTGTYTKNAYYKIEVKSNG